MIIVPQRMWPSNKRKQRGSIMSHSCTVVLAGGGLSPFVSDILLTSTAASGVGRTSIIFHDDRVGVGGDDGRVLTKRHQGAGANVFTDMGDDDAGAPVDHTGEWTAETVTESEWEVACTSEDTGTWDTFHAAVGVFTTLDTVDMIWGEFRSGGKGRTAGTNRCVATFRIREVADTSNFVDFEVDCTVIQT